ncbi:MAG: ACT domain-containing protein [Gemmatimonadota bacterium]
MSAPAIHLDLLPGPLALLRLSPTTPIPPWTAAAQNFLTISRTPTELSIVADARVVPADVAAERDYCAFRVRGPMPLHLVGVMAALAVPLAEAAVPIFVIATYDTDYLLVKAADLEHARQALERAGHLVFEIEGAADECGNRMTTA